MNSLKQPKIILLLIIVFAFLIRIIGLANWPAFFIPDEALNSYEAYSLLKTGKDHWGNPWPIFFEGFNKRTDRRPPLFIYSTIPFVAIFGLNEFSARLPAVIFGLLTVLMTYYLAKELFKKELIGLLAAFFLAISPWHIFLSRYAHEAIPAPSLSLLGIFLFLKGLKNKKILILSAIPLALNLYSYSVTKVFVPLLLLTLLIIYRKKIAKAKKCLILAFTLFLILALPFLYFHLTNWEQMQGRFNQISVFNHSFWPFLFIFNLFSYLSPSFLFTNYPFFVMILALLGGYFLWQKKGEKEKYQLLFFVIIISIVPTALTVPNPHVVRAILLLPFLEIVAAYGFWQVYNFLKIESKIEERKILFFSVIISILLLLFNISFLFKNNYPYHYGEIFYEFVGQKIVNYIKENQAQYEKIIFSARASYLHIYLLFYLNYPPAKFQSQLKREKISSNGLETISFDKYKFCNLADCYSPTEDNLYIIRIIEKELPSLKVKKIFYDKRGGLIYKAVANK